MIETEVAVVGAGLAGLYVARLLNAAGVKFLLIEARTRLGGRILTSDEAGSTCEDGFDLGPSWYWPRMQPAIGELVAELGLAAFAQNSDGDVVFERMSREPAQRYRGAIQDPQSMRLAGGTAALVRALAGDLPGDRIRLGASLRAMALVANGIELSIAQGNDQYDRIIADQVVAALSPRLLEATVAFTPAQEVATAQRWRDTPTWMAPHAKFFAI